MRRVPIIVGSALITVGTVLGVTAWTIGPALSRVGDALYRHRDVVRQTLVRHDPGTRAVAWLGDSTMMWARGVPSYARLATRSLPGEDVEPFIFAMPGLDFFHFYCVMPRVLEAAPDLVVMPANLFNFRRDRQEGVYPDLCSFQTTSALLRGAGLPWHRRSVTVPRLLLTRLLRAPLIERWVRFFEGLRVAAAESALRNPFGVAPYALPPDARAGEVERRVRRHLEHAAQRITDEHPVAQMMDATLAMVRRRGVPIVVFMAPVNVAAVAQRGQYDRARHLESVAVLRRITERHGGTFVDLYGGTLPGQFRDLGGHYDAAGMRRIAMALRPHVADALGIPRPAAAADWPRMPALPPKRVRPSRGVGTPARSPDHAADG